jgi:hypothetical protein
MTEGRKRGYQEPLTLIGGLLIAVSAVLRLTTSTGTLHLIAVVGGLIGAGLLLVHLGMNLAKRP